MLEKQMEDQIAADPKRFLEKQLTLLSRQFRIGNYRFDLLFEDRHGGKLIVEIQRGTLDRTHTYKILDYYHEYREQHPRHFVDLMVVANQIPVERKKRLSDLGIEFRELPVSRFDVSDENVSEALDDRSDPIHRETSEAPGDSVRVPPKLPSIDQYHFNSLGPSEFVNSVRELLRTRLVETRWKLGGDASLTAIYLPATAEIVRRKGRGLKTQIWMERPKKGQAACKFEVAYKISTLADEESKSERERIASSIRHHLAKQGLPSKVTQATGSTVVRRPLNLSAIDSVRNDTEEIAKFYHGEAKKVLDFVLFLDEALVTWPSTW